jgi:hypothetical protein
VGNMAGDDEIGARRGFAVVCTRLQRHVKCGLPYWRW